MTFFTFLFISLDPDQTFFEIPGSVFETLDFSSIWYRVMLDYKLHMCRKELLTAKNYEKKFHSIILGIVFTFELLLQEFQYERNHDVKITARTFLMFDETMQKNDEMVMMKKFNKIIFQARQGFRKSKWMWWKFGMSKENIYWNGYYWHLATKSLHELIMVIVQYIHNWTEFNQTEVCKLSWQILSIGHEWNLCHVSSSTRIYILFGNVRLECSTIMTEWMMYRVKNSQMCVSHL